MKHSIETVRRNGRSLVGWTAWWMLSAAAGVQAAQPPGAEAGATPIPGAKVYGTAPDGATLEWVEYPPTNGAKPPWPAVVLIHGGGFRQGSPIDSPEQITAGNNLAAAGYLALSITYRLAPPGRILNQRSFGHAPEQYDDCKMAVRAARADPRCNGHVIAVGGSAGGCHAEWLALDHTTTLDPPWSDKDRPDAVVAISAPSDFTDYREEDGVDQLLADVTNYCNVPHTNHPTPGSLAILQANSPAFQVDREVKPMLLIFAQQDVMPYEQLGDMTSKLDAAFGSAPKNYQVLTVAGPGHAFNIWTETILGRETVGDLALAFIAEALRDAPPTPTPTPSVTPTPSATPTPTATPTVTPTVTPSPSPTPPGQSTPSPTATPSPTPDLASSPRLGNISTRVSVGSGDNVLIGGFIVQGEQPKKVLIRGLGPSLSTQVAGTLSDPTVQLFDEAGVSIAADDDWATSPEKDEILSTHVAPTHPKEAALIRTLSAGTYTVLLQGTGGGTGVGLIEVYDLDSAQSTKLANISTRGLVGVGDNVMIGGFIILGDEPAKVLVRALGPELPLNGTLLNPALALYDINGSLISANDDWKNNQMEEIIATGAPPTNDRESALVATLAPGAYTAVVQGKDAGTGLALVEVYQATE